MLKFPLKAVKVLWDEYRMARQLRRGWWWLIYEVDPPGWFMRYELGMEVEDGDR